jgi:hypothetical protein
VLLLLATVAGIVTAGDRPMSYVYKRGDDMHTRINGSIDMITSIGKRYQGEFVWVRTKGHDYMIRDAATLAAVRNAFRDVEALEPAMREVERRLQPFEDQLEVIEDRVDEFSDSLGDENLSDAERDALEAKLRVAEEEMRRVEAPMKSIEAEMERLEKEEERREKIAEREFERIVERAIAGGVAQRQ